MARTREKLLEVGVSLFAKQGYRETTVGDIEAAAGLAPRAGGFYRHFKSKDQLLREMLEAYFKEVDGELSFKGIFPLGDTRAELLLIGRTILAHAERHRDFRIVLRREMRNIPKIQKLAKSINQQGAYAELLPWLALKLGKKSSVDIEAMAINIFGPVFYILYAEDQGDKPLSVDRDRFLNTWASQWATMLDAGS